MSPKKETKKPEKELGHCNNCGKDKPIKEIKARGINTYCTECLKYIPENGN